MSTDATTSANTVPGTYAAIEELAEIEQECPPISPESGAARSAASNGNTLQRISAKDILTLVKDCDSLDEENWMVWKERVMRAFCLCDADVDRTPPKEGNGNDRAT